MPLPDVTAKFLKYLEIKKVRYCCVKVTVSLKAVWFLAELTGKPIGRFLWYQYKKVEDRDGEVCYRNKKRHVDIVGYDFGGPCAVKPKALSSEAKTLLRLLNSNTVRLLNSEGRRIMTTCNKQHTAHIA